MMKDKRFLVNLSKTIVLSVALGAIASVPLAVGQRIIADGNSGFTYTPWIMPGFALIAFAGIKGYDLSSKIENGAAIYDDIIKKLSFWKSKNNTATKQR